ncbi:MAG: hypothetical protein IPN09_07705 [Bacteroidetes bacterium]|nr:hypothetical protein [Bacteroidota bacterium]
MLVCLQWIKPPYTPGTSATINGTPSASENMIASYECGRIKENYNTAGSFGVRLGVNAGTIEYDPVTF